jgi:DNA-binding PadR family transcriptional regulator
VLLEEEPRNGYALIQEIDSRSGGVWRPSAGAVYPALQLLADEGLVRAEEEENRRTYSLTDEGRRYVDENRERLAAPWDAVSGGIGEGVADLRELMKQVAIAAIEVARAGTPADVDQARRTLAETRRALYRILAEDSAESS